MDLKEAEEGRCWRLGYSSKKNQLLGGEGTLFWSSPLPPWNFSLFYFTPGNFRQNKSLPLEIPQNCVRSFGIPRPKTKTLKKSTLFFLGYPLKFQFVFNWPLEIPHAIFDSPGISISSTPLFVFFWNSLFSDGRWHKQI